MTLFLAALGGFQIGRVAGAALGDEEDGTKLSIVRLVLGSGLILAAMSRGLS